MLDVEAIGLGPIPSSRGGEYHHRARSPCAGKLDRVPEKRTTVHARDKPLDDLLCTQIES